MKEIASNSKNGSKETSAFVNVQFTDISSLQNIKVSYRKALEFHFRLNDNNANKPSHLDVKRSHNSLIGLV